MLKKWDLKKFTSLTQVYRALRMNELKTGLTRKELLHHHINAGLILLKMEELGKDKVSVHTGPDDLSVMVPEGPIKEEDRLVLIIGKKMHQDWKEGKIRWKKKLAKMYLMAPSIAHMSVTDQRLVKNFAAFEWMLRDPEFSHFWVTGGCDEDGATCRVRHDEY